MSGGSYGYLHLQIESLGEHILSVAGAVRGMAEDVKGDAPDAALALEAYAAEIDALSAEIAGRGKVMAPLIKAVEWWSSGDRGIESVRDALGRVG